MAPGIAGLTITGANASDFTGIADACSGSVGAGGNCTFDVTFTPSVALAEAAALSITDNAIGSPQSAKLMGSGSPHVILSCKASPRSGVASYNVCRGTTSGGQSTTPLNSTPINGTSYVDASYVDASATARMTCYYVVTSEGSNGVQSAPLNQTEPSCQLFNVIAFHSQIFSSPPLPG